MPVQYVTIPVTITARVDARYDRYGDLEVSEISLVAIDNVNISLDAMPQDEFADFYDKAIDAVIKYWLPVDKAELRQAIEEFTQ